MSIPYMKIYKMKEKEINYVLKFNKYNNDYRLLDND